MLGNDLSPQAGPKSNTAGRFPRTKESIRTPLGILNTSEDGNDTEEVEEEDADLERLSWNTSPEWDTPVARTIGLL